MSQVRAFLITTERAKKGAGRIRPPLALPILESPAVLSVLGTSDLDSAQRLDPTGNPVLP